MAQAIDALLLATRDDTFEQLAPRFQALEKQLLATTTSRPERQEVRRRIAERLFTEAFARNCSWPVFRQQLRRIQRLGYSRVERRYHVAALYALWCRRHPDHDDREARVLLEDAARRIRRLPRGHPSRAELQAALEDTRLRTGFNVRPAVD